MKKNKIVSVQVKVMREGISRSRRFLVSKFGGVANARRKAEQHRHYLKNVATMEQFIKATRQRWIGDHPIPRRQQGVEHADLRGPHAGQHAGRLDAPQQVRRDKGRRHLECLLVQERQRGGLLGPGHRGEAGSEPRLSGVVKRTHGVASCSRAQASRVVRSASASGAPGTGAYPHRIANVS